MLFEAYPVNVPVEPLKLYDTDVAELNPAKYPQLPFTTVGFLRPVAVLAVSYTHLTLPTKA